MLDLPFTSGQFLEVFKEYNQAIWPAQFTTYVLGLLALLLLIPHNRITDKTINIILASFWLWMGAVYHLLFFSSINPAAYLFSGLFIIQGILFFYAGAVHYKIRYQILNNGYSLIGAVLIFYAMILYPLFAYWLGHGWPVAPIFGIAPCPTAIFTFGLLLFTQKDIPGWLLIIPAFWSLVGFTAVLKLGMLEDTGLLVAGLIGTGMLLYRNHTNQKEVVSTQQV